MEETFEPLFMKGSPSEYLQVLSIQKHVKNNAIVSLVGNLPPVELISPVTRQIDVPILRKVVQSTRFCWQLEIAYQSMTRLEPALHRVYPHTLVFDGLRWHMRAYSETHCEYRDFVLARIPQAEMIRKNGELPPDILWERFVTVSIGPHPGLSENQRSVIERDYGMVNGTIETRVRAALLPYFLLTMRIGKDDLQREPNLQQVVLLNRNELNAYIAF